MRRNSRVPEDVFLAGCSNIAQPSILDQTPIGMPHEKLAYISVLLATKGGLISPRFSILLSFDVTHPLCKAPFPEKTEDLSPLTDALHAGVFFNFFFFFSESVRFQE